MFCQEGPQMGSNMEQRMHCYPLYQNLQARAEPFAEEVTRLSSTGI